MKPVAGELKIGINAFPAKNRTRIPRYGKSYAESGQVGQHLGPLSPQMYLHARPVQPDIARIDGLEQPAVDLTARCCLGRFPVSLVERERSRLWKHGRRTYFALKNPAIEGL